MESCAGALTPHETPKRTWLKPAWKPGQSGNPNGRPKGAKSILTEDLIRALTYDFKIHGPQAVVKLRLKDVATYMKICASLVPKQISVDANLNAKVEHLHKGVSETLSFADRFAEIESSGGQRALPEHVSDGLVLPAGLRVEEAGHNAPVAVEQVPGSARESE